eukprot:735462-Rhodomonas_salina.2
MPIQCELFNVKVPYRPTRLYPIVLRILSLTSYAFSVYRPTHLYNVLAHRPMPYCPSLCVLSSYASAMPCPLLGYDTVGTDRSVSACPLSGTELCHGTDRASSYAYAVPCPVLRSCLAPTCLVLTSASRATHSLCPVRY